MLNIANVFVSVCKAQSTRHERQLNPAGHIHNSQALGDCYPCLAAVVHSIPATLLLSPGKPPDVAGDAASTCMKGSWRREAEWFSYVDHESGFLSAHLIKIPRTKNARCDVRRAGGVGLICMSERLPHPQIGSQ